MNRMRLVTIAVSLVILLTSVANPLLSDFAVQNDSIAIQSTSAYHIPSATSGSAVDLGTYLIVQDPEQSISCHGNEMLDLLLSEGILTTLVNVSDLLSDPTPLSEAIAVILDASLGSENGTIVNTSLIDLLILYDSPVILMGRAAWLLHSLRGKGPPQETALASTFIYSSSEYTGAVFYTMPYLIPEASQLTSETLQLPLDLIQTEHARLVNLTASDNSALLPPVRYDSYPLDTFLVAMEDPTTWTTTGENLFINILAYSNTLRESLTTSVLAGTQSSGFLAGGFEYSHESYMHNIYSVVLALHSLLDTSDWSQWVYDNTELVISIFDEMYQDLGSEAGFSDLGSSGSLGIRSTAKGL